MNIKSVNMNKCFRCGFETLENANFCSNCGVSLKDPMPEIVYLKVEETQHEKEVENEDLGTESEIIQEKLLNEETSKSDIVAIGESMADINASTESLKEEIAEDVQGLEEPIDVESIGEKSRKILWIPEWAFCTTLLILGVLAIVTYKFINDPEWNKLVPDMSSLFVATNEIVQNEEENGGTSVIDTIDVLQNDKSNGVDENVAQQLLASEDSTYHVVVMTLKSIESAEKIIESGKYANAYIISDSTLHRVAVYNNVDKAKAKHYLDSIANQNAPGAWIFHGAVK